MKKPFLCLIGIHKPRFVDRDIEEGDFIIYRIFEECARCQKVLSVPAIQKVPKKKK